MSASIDEVGPKSVFVRFKDLQDNPFADNNPLGKNLVMTVCGAMNINKTKCEYGYDQQSHIATLRFRFTRPRWAYKAASRAAGIVGADVEIEADSE